MQRQWLQQPESKQQQYTAPQVMQLQMTQKAVRTLVLAYIPGKLCCVLHAAWKLGILRAYRTVRQHTQLAQRHALAMCDVLEPSAGAQAHTMCSLSSCDQYTQISGCRTVLPLDSFPLVAGADAAAAGGVEVTGYGRQHRSGPAGCAA